MGIDWTKEKSGENLWDGKEIKILKDLKKLIVSRGVKYEEVEKLSIAQKIINALDVLVLEKSNNKQVLISEQVDKKEKLTIKQALERIFYVIPGSSDERSCAELAKSRLANENEIEIEMESAPPSAGYHYIEKYPGMKSRVFGEFLKGNDPFEINRPAHRPAETVSRSHFIRALRFKFRLERVGKMVTKDGERLDDAAIRAHCKKSKKNLDVPSHLEALLHEAACEIYEKLLKKNGLRAYLWGRK